ncbi:MAG: hypothetical protein ACK55Z_01095, partial [bacterium]
VDTGATYSVFLHRFSAPASDPALTGPSGRPIATWGKMEIPLLFDGQHFTWNFLLAAVQLPILGMDFLRQQGLLVDVGKHQLIMTASMKVIRVVAPSGGPTTAWAAGQPPASRTRPHQSRLQLPESSKITVRNLPDQIYRKSGRWFYVIYSSVSL